MTITNKKHFTLQQTFDKVVAHLRKQGCKSVRSQGNKNILTVSLVCQYRFEAGKHQKVLKCAAGCLIPKSLYKTSFEGIGIYYNGHEPSILNVLISNLGHNTNLVCDLQGIHDGYDVHEWEYQFEKLANKYLLVYNLPK